MPNVYDNYSDEQLIDLIKTREDEKKEAEKNLKFVQNILLERKASAIADALAQKPEPFGSVSEVIGDQKITFTTPKKTEWDQNGLAKLYREISADPEENADEYIVVEYKVKEDAYKNWPSNLKQTFEPYRSVKPGTVSVKIEPVKEK